jgi:hypothetical protein
LNFATTVFAGFYFRDFDGASNYNTDGELMTVTRILAQVEQAMMQDDDTLVQHGIIALHLSVTCSELSSTKVRVGS